MTAKVWQQHRIRIDVVCFKDFIVAITNYSPDCLIQGAVVLHISVFVDEDEVMV